VNGDSVILLMTFLSPGNAACKSYDVVVLAHLFECGNNNSLSFMIYSKSASTAVCVVC
jgi:hypothetical protein